MATKYVELTYLDGPPMFASVDSRTPNKVSGHGDITELQRRGYKIVTLVLATPERINALEDALNHMREDVVTYRYEAVLEAMLQEMKGSRDGS